MKALGYLAKGWTASMLSNPSIDGFTVAFDERPNAEISGAMSISRLK